MWRPSAAAPLPLVIWASGDLDVAVTPILSSCAEHAVELGTSDVEFDPERGRCGECWR